MLVFFPLPRSLLVCVGFLGGCAFYMRRIDDSSNSAAVFFSSALCIDVFVEEYEGCGIKKVFLGIAF